MTDLNWGVIQDGGTFESLMHAILYAKDQGIVLFGRPGKDAGQDARSDDGSIIYQAKYRQSLTMDGAIQIALEELSSIKEYRNQKHANHIHWKDAHRWILVSNIRANPNDEAEWRKKVVPAFQKEGLSAEYWGIKILEGELAKHPHIRDVFFEGENRVLVSLKEAHDRLRNECIGGASLEKPMIGRESELQAITNFVIDGEKRILPIIGVAGIGKSRLIYESIVFLGQNGWRVLWALPEAMARSTDWFHLLNSNQPTCVAIDDPSDPDLLRAVIEQLAPVERRNWKVILACSSTQAEMLRPYQKIPLLAKPLVLEPINEASSKELLTSNLLHPFNAAHYHTVYRHTGGVPGWLCLVAELANRNTLREFPESVDDIASLYIDDCLSRLDGGRRQDGMLLLRFMALWGTLGFDETVADQFQVNFLATQGLNKSNLKELLTQFVKAGIIRNWGFGKRLFAIQPLIVREHILSSWLFDRNGEEYRINAEGKHIIELLVNGKIPTVELALRSICNLSRSRLELHQVYSFLKPVFDELKRIGCEGNVIDQSQLLKLIEIIGHSDPESALDCIKAVRENDKPPIDVDDPLWGKVTFDRKSVLAKLPWLLFEIAAFVADPIVAARYLNEFRSLIESEESLRDDTEVAKRPQKLLERLLCESKNAIIFAEPAKNVVLQELATPMSWPFVGTLLECLLNPEREYTEWTARWTLTIRRRVFVPETTEWKTGNTLREKAFDLLRKISEIDLRAKIWRVLAESHHQFHRLILHERLRGAIVDTYRAILVSDLTIARAILEKPPVESTVEETVTARQMWTWYLEYGKDDDLRALANHCEAACSSLSKWRLQDFFRFDTDEALAPEINRVAKLLREATDSQPFVEFFSTVKTYLSAARAGGQDMADSIRISSLADALYDAFVPTSTSKDEQNPVTKYVASVLREPEGTNDFAWWFAVRICQKYMLQVKKSRKDDHVVSELNALIELCHIRNRGRFLFELYSNPHPLNTGNLSKDEFESLIRHERDFSARQLFVLFGAFAPMLWTAVLPHLTRVTDSMNGQSPEIDNCVGVFVQMIQLSALRYEKRDLTPQLDWIFETIVRNNLDGAILGGYALTWLRKESEYRMKLSQLTRLIRARIEFEGKPRPQESFRLLPFDFKVAEWCSVDASDEADIQSFDEFCALGLSDGFIGFHWMPKFIQQLDPSGKLVVRFVEKHLSGNPSISPDNLVRLGYLASAYAGTSAAWALIAGPICQKAVGLGREERERVFFGLSTKETGVLSSAPGEIPSHYFEVRDAAVRMSDLEPPDSILRGYREWALRRAEEDLFRQRQMTEEVGSD
jgi:hypothetical protein